jgi:transposase
LLQAIYAEGQLAWLAAAPAVDTLRRVWIQQYRLEGETVYWRGEKELPPGEQLIHSPFELAARYSHHGAREWIGYTPI